MPSAETPTALRLRRIEDLEKLSFVGGVAEVDAPIELLDQLPIIGAERPDTERLRSLVRRIRRMGYGGEPRIVVQLDEEGRWILIDGGHRICAARQVAGEFWPNLFGRKVVMLHFLLRAASVR